MSKDCTMSMQQDIAYYTEQDYLRIDAEQAMERMGDKDIYLEISHYFGEHLPESIQNLDAALGQGDLESATRLAHSLKSNCASVGAELLRQGSLELEQLCRSGDLGAARTLFSALHSPLLSLGGRLMELR